jgi:Short C-terminal domain/Phospholipase_D-nuclease N-terminal
VVTREELLVQPPPNVEELHSMNLGDFLVWMIEVFFLVMAIWIFIAIFADIFRRTDLSGGMKGLWIIIIFILPFIGCLIYIIARPKVTAGDVQDMVRADAANKAVAGVSTADELTKLAQLKESGAITPAEYDSLKAKLVAG